VFQASIPRRVGAWQQAAIGEFDEPEYEELSDTAFRVSALAIDLFLAENEWRERRDKPRLPVEKVKPEALPDEGTAEEKVRRSLEGNPSATIDEAAAATDLTETAIRRTNAWKRHEDKGLGAYLEGNPDATAADAATATGFSAAKIVSMDAWKAHQAKKEARKPEPEIKERQVKEAAWRVISAPGGDPSQGMEAREHLFLHLIDWAEPKERALLHRLKQAERDKLIRHILENCDYGEIEKMEPDKKQQVVNVVAQSWLDSHEEEKRWEERNRRKRQSD
jgi:hypothetical protein